MKKFAEIAILLDIYSSILTPNQRDIMDLYYNYDLSLTEIAQNKDITRQGVHDIIRRSEDTLRKIDEQLDLVEKFAFIDTNARAIDAKLSVLSDILKSLDTDEAALNIIDEIKFDLRSIVDKITR